MPGGLRDKDGSTMPAVQQDNPHMGTSITPGIQGKHLRRQYIGDTPTPALPGTLTSTHATNVGDGPRTCCGHWSCTSPKMQHKATTSEYASTHADYASPSTSRE